MSGFIYVVLQHLGELVMGFLNRELQPPCLLVCLETVRILSRDKYGVDPFISCSAMSTLAHYAGIATICPDTLVQGPAVEDQGNN